MSTDFAVYRRDTVDRVLDVLELPEDVLAGIFQTASS